MEGTLVEVIEKYQGKTLSANLPYKTQFMIPKDDGRDMKLIVHLVRKCDHVTCYCHAVSSLHGATIAYLKPVQGMTLKIQLCILWHIVQASTTTAGSRRV